ncbi:MAG: TonB-dependent receptor [SAR86 cluster bacterium]|jgi:outer membrane receptor protein involved in Fe transport|nr:TonB-dependent receptor [SAR86 cluster bacterium]
MKKISYLLLFSLLSSFNVFSAEEDVEEIVIIGSQIKGAKITGALPVTVISSEDIDAIGAADGDELIENLVEQGMNFFNENEFVSGGVNAARGDVGAYNLRNMGVGNTLSLLNGRRLVNNAGYQTEYIGGDFVPTLTVNTNSIPVNGLDRLEVLKDGASALYGADAVAGVVNNVLDTDYVGTRMQLRQGGIESLDAKDTTFSVKHGMDLNEGKTNVSLFFNYRDRESIALSEDPKWAIGDYRYNYPGGKAAFDASVWSKDTNLRNLYTYQMPQLDMSGTAGFTDSKGETQLVASGHPGCSRSGAVDTGFGSCMVPDFETRTINTGAAPQMLRDYRGDLERTNLFVYINHELDNGNDFFSEISIYSAESERQDNNGSFPAGNIAIASDYYWSQLVPGMAGKKLRIDGWRPNTLPRIVNVDKDSYRFLAGLRGTTASNWDWETALVYSKSESSDATSNRINLNALKTELNSTSSSAFNIYNPDFSANNSQNILAVINRDDESELTMFDVKLSNDNVFDLPAGPVGALIGFEYREETYSDDRDPLLDGTIPFNTDSSLATNTHPYRSAVMGSSATEDVYGEKDVTSLFAEFQIPITDRINAQLALRHEDFSDSKSATVGKFALGYEVNNSLFFRASASTAFRAPNLVQVNQLRVARTGTRIDSVMQYVADVNNLPKSGTIGDYDFTILRFSEGAKNLEPEESDNTSFGIVLTPEAFEGLTITLDAWEIEKENTIGLFGRNNNGVMDLLLRLQAGNSNCSGDIGNPAVSRDDLSDLDSDELGYFAAAGLCPVGRSLVVKDEYLNMATRTIEGRDAVVYYDFETSLGDFALTYADSRTTTFEQTPTGSFNTLQAAIDDGTLPSYTVLDGFGDLLGRDGNYERKSSFRVNYSKGDFGASVSALKIGSFYQAKINKSSDGSRWIIPSMTTVNASVYYKFEVMDKDARVKLGIKNINDKRAPLADGYNGFFSDVHSDLGKNYYLDFRVDL